MYWGLFCRERCSVCLRADYFFVKLFLSINNEYCTIITCIVSVGIIEIPVNYLLETMIKAVNVFWSQCALVISIPMLMGRNNAGLLCPIHSRIKWLHDIYHHLTDVYHAIPLNKGLIIQALLLSLNKPL